VTISASIRRWCARRRLAGRVAIADSAKDIALLLFLQQVKVVSVGLFINFHTLKEAWTLHSPPDTSSSGQFAALVLSWAGLSRRMLDQRVETSVIFCRTTAFVDVAIKSISCQVTHEPIWCFTVFLKCTKSTKLFRTIYKLRSRLIFQGFLQTHKRLSS